MRYLLNETRRLAIVYCTHADQKSEAQQKTLRDFIANCQAKKIYVCVFESGDGNLLDNTRELLAYNYNNAVTRTSKSRCSDETR